MNAYKFFDGLDSDFEFGSVFFEISQFEDAGVLNFLKKSKVFYRMVNDLGENHSSLLKRTILEIDMGNLDSPCAFRARTHKMKELECAALMITSNFWRLVDADYEVQEFSLPESIQDIIIKAAIRICPYAIRKIGENKLTKSLANIAMSTACDEAFLDMIDSIPPTFLNRAALERIEKLGCKLVTTN